MTPRLSGLRRLSLSDLPRYKSALTAVRAEGWACYFCYLLSKEKEGRSAIFLAEDGDALCTFQWEASDSGARLDVLFPPMPFDARALERALERCNDHNGDRSARIMRIEARDVAALEALGTLRVKQRRLQYVFAPSEYDELAGRRHRTLRRHVAQLEEVADVQLVPYTPVHRDACRELLSNWRREHRATHGTAGGTSTTRRAIELAGVLDPRDLCGELVYVGGRLAAFAFGGEIRPGLACFLDAKADASIPGLSYAHRVHFLRRLRDFERVNDGSDAGRPGLRQLKDSFRPVAMIPEYRAHQEAGGDG